ncbi:metallophosphoesterase [Ileibacterium valens]|nr:metallophosphoesterase [Ileibacterium valens]
MINMIHMMNSLQKKLCMLVIGVLILVISLDISIYRMFYINPDGFRVTYKTIHSKKIPDSLNQVSLVYFSDLEYGTFSDPEKTNAVFEKIKQLNPDLFVFGGDLFASDYTVTDADKDQMNAWLASIQAPLGKFALYGEQDLVNEGRLVNVQEIYNNTQIEILDNTTRLITNQSREGIRFAAFGLDLNTDSSLAALNPEQFNFAFSHYPDHLLNEYVTNAPIDLAAAGNAHGTQITWPIKGGYRLWPGSENLNRADQKNLPFDYYLTSGLGCINIRARLNAPVEIVYFMFSNQ